MGPISVNSLRPVGRRHLLGQCNQRMLLVLSLPKSKEAEDWPNSESNTLGHEGPSQIIEGILTTYDSHTAKFALT